MASPAAVYCCLEELLGLHLIQRAPSAAVWKPDGISILEGLPHPQHLPAASRYGHSMRYAEQSVLSGAGFQKCTPLHAAVTAAFLAIQTYITRRMAGH